MIFEKIKIGKTYFHTLATNRIDKVTFLKIKDTRKMFVVGKDSAKRSVCASINGTPAQWFNVFQFGRWTDRHPETTKQKTKKAPGNKI